LKKTIHRKDKIIGNLTSHNAGDDDGHDPDGDDEKVNKAVENSLAKQDAMNDRERQEMVDAARETILTLQEMNKSKQQQLSRKQEVIEELK
jgi:hypothetical protein